MKRIALVVLVGLLAGCGSTPAIHRAPAPSVCRHRVPASMGECIKQELRSKGIRPAAPLATELFGVYHGQCVDISRWQGFPSWGLIYQAGVRCVIVQTNDGGAHNPYFAAQVRGAISARLKVGVYVFLENASGSYQADVLGSVASSARGATLGAWIDVEVPGSYYHSCETAARLRAVWHYRIVGVYSSPGNMPYGIDYCSLFSWVAEWGGGGTYPLPGFPASSIKMRQWCGTCRLQGFGGEVDRDEDLGLMALAQPTPPTHGELQRQLYAAYRKRTGLRHRINVLRVLIRVHQCAPGDHRHATPKGYRHACNVHLASGQTAHRQGAAVNRLIASLHRKGV